MRHKCVWGIYSNGAFVYDRNDILKINTSDIFNYCPYCGTSLKECDLISTAIDESGNKS